MRVSDLYAPKGPFVGKEIYIVGLGASMNIFDRSFLEDKTCILLNDTHFFIKNLGPIVLASNPVFIKRRDPRFKYKIVKARLWSSKHGRRETHLVKGWNDGQYYCFSFRHPQYGETDSRDIKCLFTEPDYYWTGGTVACYAIQFAAQAGAKSIILVGCDCQKLMGLDYLEPLQRILFYSRNFAPANWLPVSVKERIRSWNRRGREDSAYEKIYKNPIVELKSVVWERFRIPIFTLSPFVGLNDYESQYKEFYRDKSMRAFK